ncbi:MAG: PKD domain-containing protein [Chitinophagales bacterium]|nr:PKD domain-containing protein [Chitinophagales bacterium]
MKKLYPCFFIGLLLIANGFLVSLQAQCNNADFENGTLSGWTGTWGDGTCVGVLDPFFGTCLGCWTPDPFENNGLNQGPNNQPSTGLPVKNHFIMTGGFDPIAGGTVLPVVHPSGNFSARLGDAHADDAGHGGGESFSYTFTVTPNNCNFTYHYAVVLNNGGHSPGEQPYFKIRMFDGSNNLINCATYDVDATTAQTIGGFVTVGSNSYKTWTSVFIPLNNYMGQTVRIQFSTRDCAPTGCDGSHWAYAYIDAQCAPLQILSSSPTICGGQNITLTAPAGAATYSWSGPGIVSGGNSQQVTVNLAGQYTVNMTTFGTVPCTFSLDTVIAGSPSNPVANFSATTVCVGNPTTFTDLSTPAGGVNAWAWDFDNNGTPDALTQNPTHTFPAAGTYPVRLAVTWPPCIDDTTINVTVSPAPNSTFTATSPLCVGTNSTITYTGNAPANATYNWNFDGGTVVSGSGQGPYSVNWSTGGTKNITLSVSVGSCVSSVTTVQVVVNPFPGTTVSPNVAICTGGSTVLTASGGNSYTWDPPTGLSSTTGATVTASPTNTTTYTVTGVNANCTSPATVTVTVTPVPTSPFSVTSPVCTGQNSTITYTGNASSNATYNWNFNGGTIVSGSGQGPYTVNWATTGVKNITLTVDENGCTSGLTTNNITVTPGPTATFTATSPHCIGQNSTITYSGTGTGSATYTWNFDGGTVVSGSGQGPYTVNWATAGTKNVTLTVSETGCFSNSAVSVVINAIPAATFTASSPVCTGQNSTVTYTGTAPANANYTWNFDGATIVSGSGQGPYTVNWTSSGVKNLTLTVDDNGCVSPPGSATVTVNDIPVSDAGADVSFCSGNNVQIGTAPNPSYTYLWQPATGLNNTSAANPTVTLTNTTNVAAVSNYTVTTSANGCSSTDVVTVTVNPLPAPVINTPAGQCLTGNSFAFTASGNFTSNAVFMWDFGAFATPSTSASQNQTVTFSSAGSFPVSLMVTQNGCTGNASGSATVYPMPTVNFIADTLIGCENFPVCFTDISVSTSPSNFQWSFGDGGTATSQNPCYTFVAPGVYTVSLNLTSANGCAGSVTYPNLIAVIANPVAGFTVEPTVIQLPESNTVITNLSQNAASYLWQYDIAGTSTDAVPQITFTTAGVFPIVLYAYNQLGCVDSVQKTVTVIPPEAFYIPNVFTPNGDGNNDLFHIFAQEGVEVLEFQVFNRWGEKVHDNLSPWNGTYKGQPCPPGVYVYVFNLKLASGYTGLIRKGSVTLLR